MARSVYMVDEVFEVQHPKMTGVSFTPGFSPVIRVPSPGGNRFNGLRVSKERQSQNR